MEHKSNQPEIIIENNPPAQSSSNIIAWSIIAASLIIAGSILYANRAFLNKLDVQMSALGGANLGNVQQPVVQQPGALALPKGPVKVAERGDAPVLGNKNAKVTIYEFADFQCPYCKKFFDETYKTIKAKYIDTGKVKYVFRHFPLSFHVNAQISAVGAECANRQGKFWEYHDLLFKNGSGDGTNLDKASLQKYGDQLGLNSGSLGLNKNKFNQCLESNATLDIVKKDTADGSAVGVTGTPTFYVNGVQLVGAQPLSSFEQVIEAALK